MTNDERARPSTHQHYTKLERKTGSTVIESRYQWVHETFQRNKTPKYSNTYVENDHWAGLSAHKVGVRKDDQRFQRWRLNKGLFLAYLRLKLEFELYDYVLWWN